MARRNGKTTLGLEDLNSLKQTQMRDQSPNIELSVYLSLDNTIQLFSSLMLSFPNPKDYVLPIKKTEHGEQWMKKAQEMGVRVYNVWERFKTLDEKIEPSTMQREPFVTAMQEMYGWLNPGDEHGKSGREAIERAFNVLGIDEPLQALPREGMGGAAK